MYTATIICKDGNLFPALKPEESRSKRFDMVITQTDGVTIKLNAKDATALKAITTSMTRLIEVAEKIYYER